MAKNFSYKRGAGGFNVAKLLRELIAGLNETPTITASEDQTAITITTSPAVDKLSVDAIVFAHVPEEGELPQVRLAVQQEETGQAVEQTITTPYGVSRTGRLRLELDSPSGTPRWVLSYEGNGVENLTPYGGFEGVLDLSEWDPDSTYGGMTLAAAADGHTGDQSLGFTTPGTGSFYRNYSPPVAIPEAVEIQIASLYMKQVSANLTNLIVSLVFYDEAGDQIASYAADLTNPSYSVGSWVAFAAQSFVSPIGARSLRFVVACYSSGTASVELLRIDDLTLSIPATEKSISFNPGPRIDNELTMAAQDDTAAVPLPPHPHMQIIAGYDSASNLEGIFARNWVGQKMPIIAPGYFLPFLSTVFPWAMGGAVSNALNLLTGASYASNDVLVYPIFIPHPFQMGRFGYNVISINAARTLYWGLYTGGSPFGGNRITYTSDPAAVATGARSLYLSGASRQVYRPGWYYLAFAQDGTTNTTIAAFPAAPASINAIHVASGLTSMGVVGKAANQVSGGVMPATLGNITAIALNVPYVVMESS